MNSTLVHDAWSSRIYLSHASHEIPPLRLFLNTLLYKSLTIVRLILYRSKVRIPIIESHATVILIFCLRESRCLRL